MSKKIRVGVLTAPHIDYEKKSNSFILKKVHIGIGFHWDRYEDQEFQGDLIILTNTDNTQTAVNTLDLEDYLVSVISSEMSADSPLELLKAHAVISRSWAVNALRQNTIHEGFDVCADDHCQRYEGLARIHPQAQEAVEATRGLVLTYPTEQGIPTLCDTRYHKCCGGKTERFETCWEDTSIPYLTSVDCPYCAQAVDNQALLQRILNDYDQETKDFYQWHIRYTQAELRQILYQKSGIDFGDILRLTPIAKGASGRIYSLEIIGSLHRDIIGKELKIRQYLSPTCLYSSWFDIAYEHDEDPAIPSAFLLSGRGWGHGVGLCQIGAAVMAEQGFSYQDILSHYYPGTTLRPMDDSETLHRYIEEHILPRYATFDRAHQQDHVESVIRESTILAREHQANEDMAYTIAAYHDLGLSIDREYHHLHSGDILSHDPQLLRWFTPTQIQTMREAVEDHRASNKQPPRSIYGAIVAEADRQIDAETIFRRTLQYGLKRNPTADFEWHFERAYQHLLDKYAEGGYLRLWLNSERNRQGLIRLRAIIHDKTTLRDIYKRLFDSL